MFSNFTLKIKLDPLVRFVDKLTVEGALVVVEIDGRRFLGALTKVDPTESQEDKEETTNYAKIKIRCGISNFWAAKVPSQRDLTLYCASDQRTFKQSLSAINIAELFEENYTAIELTGNTSDDKCQIYLVDESKGIKSYGEEAWNTPVRVLDSKPGIGKHRKLFTKGKYNSYEAHYQVSTGKHISSNGNINYTGGYTQTDLERALRVIFSRYPGSAVLDGTCNYMAPEKSRTAYWVRPFYPYADIIGTIHTGVSGIFNSGVIIPKEMYELMPSWWVNEMKENIEVYNR